MPAADTVLVKCNGETLTSGEVDEMIERRLSVYRGQIQPQQLAQLMPRMREQVQEEFVMRTLLEEESKKQDVTVDDAEIDTMIEETKANLPAGVTYDQFLEMQNLTEDTIRGEVRMQLGIRALLDTKLGDNLEPSEEEIAAFYESRKAEMTIPETVRASHILIKLDEGADDAGKQAKKSEADAIRKELLDGADFAKTAQEKSACPSSSSGGDLGVFGRGQMVPEFENAAFTQAVGEVGDVVETQFGYHIIKVMEKNEGGERALEEVREDIKTALVNQRRGTAFQDYIAELREAAEISYPAGGGPPPPVPTAAP
jgi:peptidyl-prolyl cis-trans isomerase C